LAYAGVGPELVAGLQYTPARPVGARLAVSMGALVAGVATAFDVVTWAPTSVERRRERGFDQAELLARRIAREVGLPSPALLRRAHGPPQTGRHAAERHLGPCFTVVAPRSRLGAIPASVLLVDDVVTTGATLTSAARALRQAGVTTVVGLAAARTPLKTRRVASDTRK
jgi:predicted amidophosphoribosyltransferase